MKNKQGAPPRRDGGARIEFVPTSCVANCNGSRLEEVAPLVFEQAFQPLLSKIKSHALRDKIIKAWRLGCEKGKWDKIDDIFFTLLIPTQISLIEHTIRVTELCLKVAESRKGINLDILIAGALTHDVGKLLEYTRGGSTSGTGNKIVKSETGKRMRHPVIGYGLALEAGLPLEVAHIIFAHSYEGDEVERSKEAIIVHHCDFIDFELIKSNIKKT